MTKVDEAIERCVAQHFPKGRAVSIRIDDGPPQQGLICGLVDVPFPPLVRELKTPEGKAFKIQVRCYGGFMLVTWG